MDARLTLDYVKLAEPGIGYLMKTAVNETNTDPAELYDCLLVQKGYSGLDEVILRVAVYADIHTTPKPLLPTQIRNFSAASLGGIVIQPNDIIRIYSPPPVWQFLYGAASADKDYKVVTVVTPTLPYTEVVVDQDFYAFGDALTFKVYRGAALILDTQTDGLANRDYTGFSGITEFRTRTHGDFWVVFADADNKFESLRAQGQSLVDAYNSDSFTENVEDIYT